MVTTLLISYGVVVGFAALMILVETL